ncbi:hypothetical protein ACWZHB_02780 [Nocardia sp. FBN12]|uniref:hypothetical protein n=1 Tax=Nocardia sp. FBN12 TaxID=3419766 RepID=UPI003D06DB83
MSDHIQMEPPDYHRCFDTVSASPVACRDLLQRLSEMTEYDIHSRWSPWKGQEPPPYGSQVGEQIPVEVQLVMLQAQYDSYGEVADLQLRDLAAVVGVHPMQIPAAIPRCDARSVSDDHRQSL